MNRFSRPLSAFVLTLSLAILLGCSDEPEPTHSVYFGRGLLHMELSLDWELVSSSAEEEVYVHRRFDDVRLFLSGETEEFGHPLRVPDVKSLVGKELNREFGGVTSRVSLGGNAMLTYTRERMDDYDDPIHCEEWVLARPVGEGDFARVEISLRMPPERRASKEMPLLIEALDRQIGDARIPMI